jgi:hypothetical protein
MFSQSWSRARTQSSCPNPAHESVSRAILLVGYTSFLYFWELIHLLLFMNKFRKSLPPSRLRNPKQFLFR